MPDYSRHFYTHVHTKAQRSAEEVVPDVLRLVPAESVIDVGCGTGDWLEGFSRHGVKDYLGVDGSWAAEHLRIPQEHFQCRDLREPLPQDRRYDLVVSLEVAEHLPAEHAEPFIHSLAELGDVVLFSAAIPMSGGTRHVNEQWPDYWIEKFSQEGYIVIDCLRERYWNHPNLAWFYSQNMFLFVRQEALSRYPALQALRDSHANPPLPLVHPGQFLYMNKMNLTLGDIGKWFTRTLRRAIQKRFYK